MALKDFYSSKDSNRNRKIDARESNKMNYVVGGALAIITGLFIYYNFSVLPDQPVHIPPSQHMLEPPPPPPQAYPNDVAKPYDVNKPPYEQ